MSKIPSFIQAQPLYLIPGANRASDRVVPAERLDVRAENGQLQVTVDTEAPFLIPRIYPVRYRADWGAVDDAFRARRQDHVLGGYLPDGEIDKPTERTWFATNDGRVFTGSEVRTPGGMRVMQVERLLAGVDAAWIENSREPIRRAASFSALVQEVLVGCGWSPLQGSAIAEKDFETAVGVRTAFVRVSSFDKERFNCSVHGQYESEGRNVLEPHSVLLPWDASNEVVRRLAEQFAMGADQVIGETYAARLHRQRGG